MASVPKSGHAGFSSSITLKSKQGQLMDRYTVPVLPPIGSTQQSEPPRVPPSSNHSSDTVTPGVVVNDDTHNVHGVIKTYNLPPIKRHPTSSGSLLIPTLPLEHQAPLSYPPSIGTGTTYMEHPYASKRLDSISPKMEPAYKMSTGVMKSSAERETDTDEDECRIAGNTETYMKCVIDHMISVSMEPQAIYIGNYYSMICCKQVSFDCTVFVVCPNVKYYNVMSGRKVIN